MSNLGTSLRRGFCVVVFGLSSLSAHAFEAARMPMDISKLPDGARIVPSGGFYEGPLVTTPTRGMSLQEFFVNGMGAFFDANSVVIQEVKNEDLKKWWVVKRSTLEAQFGKGQAGIVVDPTKSEYFIVKNLGAKGIFLEKIEITTPAALAEDLDSQRELLRKVSAFMPIARPEAPAMPEPGAPEPVRQQRRMPTRQHMIPKLAR